MRALWLAVVATASLVGVALAVRILNPFGAPEPSVSDLVPHLWGIGALVVLLLTQAWAPTFAWCAAIVGSCASALGAVGMAREIRVDQRGEPAPALELLAIGALVIPAAIAASYATWTGRGPRAVAAAWMAIVVLATALVTSFVTRTMGGEGGGVPQWLWLGVIAVLTGSGLARDLRPAYGRTRERLAAGGTRGSSAAGGTRGSSPAGVLSSVRIFVDELVPGREAGRAEAAEDERGRLAADLHADVLPSLRRALAEAEAGGTVERLAADLRMAVDEVESMLLSRRSIVLEEMGLLAGVEWLAERVEDRSDVRVEIVVGGASTDDRPPRDVERAAFRVAQLALDNVVRHAPGSSVEVEVVAGASAVRLRIEDDGDGPPVDEAAATRSGRRGIADMRAEARACSASLGVGRGTGGRGTAIELRWPS